MKINKLVVIFLILLSPGIAMGVTLYLDDRLAADCDGAATYYDPVTEACVAGAGAVGHDTFAEIQSAVRGSDTVEIVYGSGPYRYQLKPSATYDSVTWNFNGSTINNSIDLNAYVTAGTHKWVASDLAGEYYFVEIDDTEPWTALFGTSSAVESAIILGQWHTDAFALHGANAVTTTDNWAWRDGTDESPVLGFSTFYVKLLDTSDPTGQGNIMAPVEQYCIQLPAGRTGHIFNDAVLIGANNSTIAAYEAFTIRRSMLEHAGGQGILLWGNTNGTSITYNKFEDTGHRGVNIDDTNALAGTIEVSNNTFIGCHLAFRYSSAIALVVNFYNNVMSEIYAGAIEWTDATGTFNEDYNIFHVDFDSPHVSKKISFVPGGDTSQWATTGANSIPAGAATNGDCDASESNCGTDAEIDSDGKPVAGSPVLRVGISRSAIHEQATFGGDIEGIFVAQYEVNMGAYGNERPSGGTYFK